jgi:hypothetical protein
MSGIFDLIPVRGNMLAGKGKRNRDTRPAAILSAIQMTNISGNSGNGRAKRFYYQENE